MPWDDMPHFTLPTLPTGPADFDSFDPNHMENIDDYPGYLWNTYHMQALPEKKGRGPLEEVPDYFYNLLQTVKAKAGPEVSIHAEVFSPITFYMELFGYESALMGMITDPGKVHAVLDRLSESIALWARALAGEGVDALLISSAFVGAPFLSRKHYQEFVVPYERRVTSAVKSTGTVVYTHTCGSIGDRLDLFVETGTQGIDTLDPPPLGNGDLAAAKRDWESFARTEPVAILRNKTERK
jgi:uroporphyrinogen-III decarboxylase